MAKMIVKTAATTVPASLTGSAVSATASATAGDNQLSIDSSVATPVSVRAKLNINQDHFPPVDTLSTEQLGRLLPLTDEEISLLSKTYLAARTEHLMKVPLSDLSSALQEERQAVEAARSRARGQQTKVVATDVDPESGLVGLYGGFSPA